MKKNKRMSTGEPWIKASLEAVKRKKLPYSGHAVWKPAPCVEKDLIQGTTSGLIRRRLRTSWLDNKRESDWHRRS